MKNLMQRIIEVRMAVDYIQKDKSVDTGRGTYKAVTHDAVTGILREHMNKAGIVCFPFLVESASMPKEEGAKQFRYEATYDFHFVNADDPADQKTIRIQAHAMDSGDKAPGKALSYAKKNAVLKLFEIETGEDEESRYNEFDITPYLEDMADAESVDALNAAHEAAKSAAKGQKDRSLSKSIADLYAKRLRVIAGPQPLADDRFQNALAAVKDGKFSADKLRSEYKLTEAQEAELAKVAQ